MVDAEIVAYYERGLERDRLASGRQRIEFLRIWDLLEGCLPAAPAPVVDVGGGLEPTRYCGRPAGCAGRAES